MKEIKVIGVEPNDNERAMAGQLVSMLVERLTRERYAHAVSVEVVDALCSDVADVLGAYRMVLQRPAAPPPATTKAGP